MNEQFSAGTVLGTGFRVWIKNILPFTVITAIVYAPFVIWGIVVTTGRMNPTSLVTFSRYGFGLALLLQILAAAALTYGVVMELQGHHASIGACVGKGLLRFFPVLGVGFLVVLISAIGFVALFVPGVILWCTYYVATQASVLEKPGIIGALKRSAALTKGHRAEIFGILLVLGLLQWGLRKLIEAVMLPLHTQAEVAHYLYLVIGMVVVTGTLQSVMASVSYFYLRQEKEGTSAAELAAVFE